MKFSTIRALDVANGPGIRVTIFVSGCSHNCNGCFNEELQDFQHGTLWTEKDEEEFIEKVAKPQVTGVSILGGEPLEQLMDDSLFRLLGRIKKEMPEKSSWLWTGDIFEEAIKNPKKRRIIECLDVLIDGPFILAERNLKLKYRGSENQRVIDVVKSFETGKTVFVKNA